MIKYWPGGIPEVIRWSTDPIEDLGEAVKGWQLFLEVRCIVSTHAEWFTEARTQENWVPRDDGMQNPSYELRQRRSLLEKWAVMSQESRDLYQGRAPSRLNAWWAPSSTVGTAKSDSQPFAWCYCLAPLDTDRNRGLWTKTHILLYHLDGNGDGPLFGHGHIAVAPPNPASDSVTPETFLRWRYIETADFANISMTVHGTLVYTGHCSIFLCDQETLETGLMLFCDFTHNGAINLSKRMRPTIMSMEIIHWLQGRNIKGIIEGAVNSWHQPVDMEQPVIDILHDIADMVQSFDGDYDTWKEDIENLAPGYLEMEDAGGGMVGAYDHGLFRTEEELEKMERREE